jgi:hypothetical protein
VSTVGIRGTEMGTNIPRDENQGRGIFWRAEQGAGSFLRSWSTDKEKPIMSLTFVLVYEH